MRRVAEELGTGAGSLYWHVRNKEELSQLIVERVTETLVLPEPDPSRWKEQLCDLAHQMRATLKRHRDVARLNLGRIPMGPNLAVTTEWLFSLLKPVGIPRPDDRVPRRLLRPLRRGLCVRRASGSPHPPGEELTPEEITTMFRDYALSLPDDRFPHTRAAVDLLFGGGPDERYEFGIDLVLLGLSTFADRDE